MRLAAALFVTATATYWTSAASAQERELSHTTPVFLGTHFGVTAAVTLGSLFLPKPTNCSWCAQNGFDTSVRSALVWQEPKVARTASDITVGVAIPLGTLAFALIPALSGDHKGQALENAAIVANATMTAVVLNQATKVLAGRQRPGCALSSTSGIIGKECNVSFYSGHTSAAFAMASSVTTVLALRGSRVAPWAGIGLGTLALAGGTLRIMGDAHWASDVLVGLAIGTAAGVLMPLLLHPRAGAASTVSGLTVGPAPSADVGFSMGGVL